MEKKNKNFEIYDQLSSVPVGATKPITGGKLKGYTNITPQWRYERLTEVFGPCGFGWKYDKPEFELVPAPNGETVVFCSVNLYVKWNGEWSEPIPGEGGNKFISVYNNGSSEVSDECRKMALTDALSIAAQRLGLAARVYYREGRDSKYYEEGQGFFDDTNTAPLQTVIAEAQPEPQKVVTQQPAKPQPTTVMQPAPAPKKAEPAPVVDSAPVSNNYPYDVVTPFGKYKGKCIGEIIGFDRSYIEWGANKEKHDSFWFSQYGAFHDACVAALGAGA